MNFLNLLSDIEQVDPEVYERLDSRRRVFKHMSGVGQKLAAAALPMFIGSVFNKAYAQTPASVAVADVLNFALKLEYLEMYFYQQRSVLTGLSSVNLAALATIATDEANHVSFLRTAITSAGATPITDPTAAQFDYSGGRGSQTGPFADWRTNPATYLALAQAFEDTGVRAYKGAAPLMSVMANKTVLTAALNIHSVEARHASHIRAMRRAGASSSTPSQGVAASPYDAQPKSWVSGTDNGGPAATYTAPVYGAGNASGLATGVSFPAEDNVSQGGITLSGTTLPNTSGFPSAAYSEAFDEALDVTTVSTIARGFTVASSTLF
jgi:hypothetical protein